MNETFQSVELAKSYLLLNHGPVVLVSSAFHGRRNVAGRLVGNAARFRPAQGGRRDRQPQLHARTDRGIRRIRAESALPAYR